jgi:hypothetical protein
MTHGPLSAEIVLPEIYTVSLVWKPWVADVVTRTGVALVVAEMVFTLALLTFAGLPL